MRLITGGMTSKPRIYADACCFIEAVRHRRGLALSADGEEAQIRDKDCWFFRRLCDASRDGAIHLVTSMLSVAECVNAGEPDGPSQETRDLFVEFLTSGTVVELVEADIFVVERARDLHWNDKLTLKGADLLHVATALNEKCTEFLTLDGKIKKPKFVAAVSAIGRLGLPIRRPSDTGYLPNEYRTNDLLEEAKNDRREGEEA